MQGALGDPYVGDDVVMSRLKCGDRREIASTALHRVQEHADQRSHHGTEDEAIEREHQPGAHQRAGDLAIRLAAGDEASLRQALEAGASFALNRQKLLDFGFRSLHVSAEAAKMLARTYYGAGPTKSYYEGCSQGGRQGLTLAQKQRYSRHLLLPEVGRG